MWKVEIMMSEITIMSIPEQLLYFDSDVRQPVEYSELA